ncbi:MAG TPA: hypothetical protein PKX92_11145 [Edaphocola sp.]|nr:hypothetical protein [Edaphocola sp.]
MIKAFIDSWNWRTYHRKACFKQNLGSLFFEAYPEWADLSKDYGYSVSSLEEELEVEI